MSLTRFPFRFTPSYTISICALITIVFLTRLGFWQCARAVEKQHMLASYATKMHQKPYLWHPGAPLPDNYSNIKLAGTYLPITFFLDNQHHNHQFGYDVLTPLQLKNGGIILVDRGFIAGDISRRTLPTVTTPMGEKQPEGSVYYPSKKQWLLGRSFEIKPLGTIIIERIDFKAAKHILHKSVYPVVLRLNSKDENGFIRDWAVVALSPDRHYGYAAQWFAMALIVFILYVTLNLKKRT